MRNRVCADLHVCVLLSLSLLQPELCFGVVEQCQRPRIIRFAKFAVSGLLALGALTSVASDELKPAYLFGDSIVMNVPVYSGRLLPSDYQEINYARAAFSIELVDLIVNPQRDEQRLQAALRENPYTDGYNSQQVIVPSLSQQPPQLIFLAVGLRNMLDGFMVGHPQVESSITEYMHLFDTLERVLPRASKIVVSELLPIDSTGFPEFLKDIILNGMREFNDQLGDKVAQRRKNASRHFWMFVKIFDACLRDGRQKHELFIDEAGARVHPNSQAYALWRSAIADTLSAPAEEGQETSHTGEVSKPAEKVTVYAQHFGSMLNGPAHFQLIVNGQSVGGVNASLLLAPYEFELPQTLKNITRIEVYYDNDITKNYGSDERDLIVNRVQWKQYNCSTQDPSVEYRVPWSEQVIASGGHMFWGGRIICKIPVAVGPQPQGSELVISARTVGTAPGGAHFVLLVNGERLGEATTTSHFSDYRFKISHSLKEIRELRLRYDNDITVNYLDNERDLEVASLNLNGEVQQPNADHVTYQLIWGSIIPGRGLMIWQGDLVFSYE